jgi:hypothetical protein
MRKQPFFKFSSQIVVVVFGLLSTCVAQARSPVSWQGQAVQDEMTDSKSYVAVASSIKPVWASQAAVLAVAKICESGALLFYISHPFVVGEGAVTVRFDKNPPRRIDAYRSKDMKALMIGQHGKDKDTPDELVAQIAKSKEILIRYEDAGHQVITAQFTGKGLADQLKKMQATCGNRGIASDQSRKKK